MNDYVLGLDVWEGSLDIDEQELLDAGVGFLIIRLNDINGGTHRDENFGRQWEQAERFIRWPYFVYNPWLSGKANVEWLGDNLPAGVKFVSVDVEVKRVGYSPAAYGAELGTFLSLARRHWKLGIYTGGWFLPLVAGWPADCEYWWARYPYLLYPAKAKAMTWEELRARLGMLSWSPGAAPGPVVVWQCSGDRMKLPGCSGRAVDVNVTRLTTAELAARIGGSPAAERWEEAITAWARRQPDPYNGPGPDGVIG